MGSAYLKVGGNGAGLRWEGAVTEKKRQRSRMTYGVFDNRTLFPVKSLAGAMQSTTPSALFDENCACQFVYLHSTCSSPETEGADGKSNE